MLKEGYIRQQMYVPHYSKETNIPWSKAFWPGLTPFGPHMWQAGAETELTLTVSPTTAVGQKALFHGKKFIIIFALKSR